MNDLVNPKYTAEDEPYIKMIYELAHKYAENARCSFEDYVSVGLMALHKARQTYNPNNPERAQFITHAYNVIQRDIMKEWQSNANELSCSPYHISNTDGAKEEVSFQNATIVSMHQKEAEDDHGVAHDIATSGISNTSKTAKSVPSGSFSPEEYAHQTEIIEKIDAILDTLPPDDKEIVIQRMFQGETFQFIADKMGMDWRAVNYRFHKVKDGLKQKLVEAGLDIYA